VRLGVQQNENLPTSWQYLKEPLQEWGVNCEFGADWLVGRWENFKVGYFKTESFWEWVG